MKTPAPSVAKRLLSGNEAIALGAWEAGVRYAAAYPGTPSTEILPALARYAGVQAEWSSNEKVALDAAAGASFAGARALAAMKHVGVNVASDSLMTLSYTGVGAGLVLISADEAGQSDGGTTQEEAIDHHQGRDDITIARRIEQPYERHHDQGRAEADDVI